MKMKPYIIILLAIFFAINCGGGGGGSGEGGGGEDPAPENKEPIAAFTTTPEFGNAPLVISVNASGSIDPDGSIETYAWDFGDGTTSEGITATHQYDDDGDYTIKLTVTDNQDSEKKSETTITVTPSGTNYTLNGTIYITAGTTADTDVNDIDSIQSSNNNMESAQEITNPAVVGGFLNIPFEGMEAGALYTSGDESDFYKVTLTGNEIISLSIANRGLADLDLYLYDEDATQVAKSTGTSNTEYIEAETSGVHYIEVRIYGGTANNKASNYVLNIGQNLSSTMLSSLPLESEFVPGEIIVEFKNPPISNNNGKGTSLPDKNQKGLLASIKATGLRTKSKNISPGRSILLSLGDEQNSKKVLSALGALEQSNRIKNSLINKSDDTRKKIDTLLAVKALRSRSDVVNADLNYIRKAFVTTPDDPSFAYQWHYPMINLPQAWDLTGSGKEVIVGVIDTGVLLNHPEMIGQVVSGYDFIRDSSRALDGDGIDGDPDDPGDQAFGNRSSFHGTHVSGTIAAASNNTNGVSGIAWKAKIMPLRVLGKNGGTDYDIMQAVRYAAGLENDSGKTPSKIADIINLSFGGPSPSPSAKKVYEEAKEKGVIIIAAAGNESSSSRSYPAAHDCVVAVSAVGPSRELAPYSNYGTSYDKWIDIAAPGGDMTVNINGDGYSDGVLSIGANDSSGEINFGYFLMEGTSMASPHVAGVAALMKSVYPSLTPDNFDSLLESGTITDDEGSDIEFGYGIINAYLAVLGAIKLSGDPTPTPNTSTLVASPSSLHYDISVVSRVVSLTNGGSGDLTILSSASDKSWITISEKSVDASKLGSYTITIDRTDLTAGIHTGTVTFASSANNYEIPVMLQVGGDIDNLNAGHMWVQLVDSSTGEGLYEIHMDPENGQYDFTFTGVEPGAYQVYAGTDHNENNFICDGGEACGAFITLSSPKKLIVNDDMTGLDFTVGFQSLISSDAAGNEYTTKSYSKRPILKKLKNTKTQ